MVMLMKNFTIMIISVLVIALLLVGCSGPKRTSTTTSSGDTSIDAVSSEITDVGLVDDDLDLGELDSLDSELANLDW